jgi:hypothetical protein
MVVLKFLGDDQPTRRHFLTHPHCALDLFLMKTAPVDSIAGSAAFREGKAVDRYLEISFLAHRVLDAWFIWKIRSESLERIKGET